jgi:hypothetical protein
MKSGLAALKNQKIAYIFNTVDKSGIINMAITKARISHRFKANITCI